MRRISIAAAVLVGFASPAATVATGQATPDPRPADIAAAADTAVVSGVVTDVLVEVPGEQGNVVQVLQTGTGVLPLAAGSDLPTGREVTVVLDDLGDTSRVVDVVRNAPDTATAAPAATAAKPATRRVYVAVAQPRGVRQRADVDRKQIAGVVAKASSYWRSQTGGRVSFKVVDYVRSYRSRYGCDDAFGMWDEALKKFGTKPNGDSKAFGVDRHLIVVLPEQAFTRGGCYFGYGTINGLHAPGGALYVTDQNRSLYAHELGHNLGLQHSNSFVCRNGQDASAAIIRKAIARGMHRRCTVTAYDDIFDVMGFSGATYGEGNLNGAHLDDLGLQPYLVRTLEDVKDRRVRIAPLSATSRAARVVKILDSRNQSYFVEYRIAAGRDRVARRNPRRPQLGVRILREDPTVARGWYTGSLELDATPSTDYTYDRALPVGQVFRSASGNTTIRLVKQTRRRATLEITHRAR